MSDNAVKLLFNIFKAYDIPITCHTIEQTIKTHPAYPSILSVSDALDGWNIKHAVLKLSFEKLRALDIPVIAHLKKEEYVWVTQITDSKVYYWDSSDREKSVCCNSFKKAWTGIALAFENIAGAGENDFNKERIKAIKQNIVRYGITGSCIALFALLTFFSWIHDRTLSLLPKLILFFVNSAGCCISYLLILQEKRQSTGFVQLFCKADAHIDCNQVTQSQYSKLFGLISWAETGMAYFCAVMLWVAIAPVSAVWRMPLWWLFLVPLPITVWSLFTQAFLLRKWCLFCCATVFLLWINAGIFYFFFPIPDTLPVVESVFLSLLILACTAVVMYISRINTADDKYSEQRETARIKYDFQTIQCHLSESRNETSHAGFVWGNVQFLQEITLYVSIACSHCGNAVKELQKLADIYANFSYRLMFAVHSDNFEQKSNIIVQHLISLYKIMNDNAFFNMLDAW